MKLHLTIELPAGRRDEVLKLLRQFEQSAPNDIHLYLFVDAPELTAEDVVRTLNNIGIDKNSHDISITRIRNGGVS